MDFMEAPSQMFENWCWEPLMLKKMSSHYHTKDPLPNALIEKIIQRCLCIYLFIGMVDYISLQSICE